MNVAAGKPFLIFLSPKSVLKSLVSLLRYRFRLMMSSAASTEIVKGYYTDRKKTKRGADGFSDGSPTLILSQPGEGTIFLSKKLL